MRTAGTAGREHCYPGPEVCSKKREDKEGPGGAGGRGRGREGRVGEVVAA